MTTPAAHTLSKTERLCSKKDISTLFSKGKWGVTAHMRYCWTCSHAQRTDSSDDLKSAVCEESFPNRILVSVPKRYFKRAVKRNLLKRRMHEAYRLQKELLDCNGVDFLLSWTSKEIGDWETVREEVAAVLTRINMAVEKRHNGTEA